MLGIAPPRRRALNQHPGTEGHCPVCNAVREGSTTILIQRYRCGTHWALKFTVHSHWALEDVCHTLPPNLAARTEGT